MKAELGDVIRQLRLAAGLSQAELAAQAGISAPLLSLIEKNRREPTLRGLRTLAAKLGMPAGVLFAVALANAIDDATDPTAREVTDRLVEVARKQLLEKQFFPPHPRRGASPRASLATGKRTNLNLSRKPGAASKAQETALGSAGKKRPTRSK